MGIAIQASDILQDKVDAQKQLTPQEFLMWERKQRLKHEFSDGKFILWAAQAKNIIKLPLTLMAYCGLYSKP
jgi:hypothetical protein